VAPSDQVKPVAHLRGDWFATKLRPIFQALPKDFRMTPRGLAKISAPWAHYAWIILAAMFLATLVGMGVRSAPGVIIVPLQRAFGWEVATISGAVSLNILLSGLLGPFMAALLDRFGLKRTILASLYLLLAGAMGSAMMTEAWQLYLTWGVMVGVGSSGGAIGIGAAVVNRWFQTRRGFAMGVMISANAAGQLIFLPVLAGLSQAHGWQSVSLAVSLAVAALIPLMLLVMADRPDLVGQRPYGAITDPAPQGAGAANPVTGAFAALRKASRNVDFWLLAGSFGVCGFSANGLVGTHMIAYCVDNGMAELLAASLLASLGIFSLIGSTISGWLTDRYNPRVILFYVYGLRGLALLVVPFTPFDPVSLTIFAIIYGLDWIATGPPTFALVNETFGERAAPVVISWIFVVHQIGGALASLGAGSVRGLSGSYMLAYLAAGLACMMAALLVTRVRHRRAVVA
jgi:MFS family permease